MLTLTFLHILTHGWIGLNCNNNVVLYHISLRQRLLTRKQHIKFAPAVDDQVVNSRKLDRSLSITTIRDISLKLLSSSNIPLSGINDLFVDIIIPVKTNRIYNIYNYMDYDDIICWNTNFDMIRAEDLFRDKQYVWIHNNIPSSQATLSSVDTHEHIVYVKFNPEADDYNTVMLDIKSICNTGYYCMSDMISDI
jgi:hypothetical protein